MSDDDLILPEEPASRSNNPDGRPPLLNPDERTLRQIKSLGGLQCTIEEAAASLGVSRRTLYVFFEKYPEAHEAWHAGRELGRVSVRRAQYKMAQTNPTMNIWWSKNNMGQTDKVETTQTIVTITPEERLARIRELQGKLIQGEVVDLDAVPVLRIEDIRK
jgi:hypothetical protein